MSVDYELEPYVKWIKIKTAIQSGKIPGVTVMPNPEKRERAHFPYILKGGRTTVYIFVTKDGDVLFKEFGSRWSSTNPILERIAKHFKVKYYADLDEEAWNRHVDRTSSKPATQKSTSSQKPSGGFMTIMSSDKFKW